MFLIGATTQLDSLPVLVTAFLVGMFEYLLLNKKDKLTISFINNNENEFLNNSNSNKQYLVDAIDKSYVFAKSLSYRKYLEIFILFSGTS